MSTLTCRRAGLVFLTASLTLPASCLAQAWLPDAGEGSIQLMWGYFDGGDHLYADDSIDGRCSLGYCGEGDRIYLGEERNHTAMLGLELGVHERVALRAQGQYVWSQYDGNAAWNLDIDDGEYRGTVQDVLVELRALAWRGRGLRLAPFVAYGFPAADYETVGHAAPGRHLRSWSLGLFAARSLRRGDLDLSYRYSDEEENQGFDLSHSLVTLGLQYPLHPRWSLRLDASHTKTHGGIRWVAREGGGGHGGGSSGQLDATVSAARAWRVGGSVAFRLRRGVHLSAGYTNIVAGSSTIDGQFFHSGLSIGFRTPWAERELWR